MPAGSVYLYRANDATPVAELVKAMSLNESISDEYPRLGFGYTLVGAWDARSFDPVRAERSPT